MMVKGDTHTRQHFLLLPLAPEVGYPGLGRGVGHREVDYPTDAGPDRRIK